MIVAHLLVAGLCAAGFAALALGMARHQHELLGRSLPRAAGLAWRGLGAFALGLAWGLGWREWGGPLGAVVFWAHAMLAAGLVYLGLLVRRRTPGTARHVHRPPNGRPG